jgi:ATP adenylyltransferase
MPQNRGSPSCERSSPVSLEQLWAGWRNSYVTAASAAERHGPADEECVFCRIIASGPPDVDNGIIWRGEHAFVVLNAYPYASGHVLAMPNRHGDALGALSAPESAELWWAVRQAIAAVEVAYHPDGVNMGANLGRAAGAGIPRHLHLHVLPRWSGDTNFMTTVAGVRVLPEALPESWARLRAAWPEG